MMIFAGLGFFLFGMYLLESSLRALAGKKLKEFLAKFNSSKFKSLIASMIATGILQSSSLITLIILSFIGAGLINLTSAVAMVFGANIGTTFTAWLVALFGFKMHLDTIFYFFIAVGGVGAVLNERYRNIFILIFSVGMLFYGLELMKESMSGFSKDFNLEEFSKNYFVYFLVGLGLTAIIQSSSASVAIVESALYSGIIDFKLAAAFVIGANVGTTVTALIGAIGGNKDKKRVALAHLIFNLSVGFVALLFIDYLIKLTDFESDAVIKIALFHTLFNVLGVLVWYPFLDVFVKIIKKIIKKEKVYVTKYIHSVDIEDKELAREALRKEIKHLGKKSIEFASLAMGVKPNSLDKPIDELLKDGIKEFDYEKAYKFIRELEGEIYKYASKIEDEKLFKVTMYLATANKAIKDMIEDIKKVDEENEEFLRNIRYQILKATQIFYLIFLEGKEADLEAVYLHIAKSYKKTSDLIKLISDEISGEINARMINMLHLSKVYAKSLKNVIDVCNNGEKVVK